MKSKQQFSQPSTQSEFLAMTEQRLAKAMSLRVEKHNNEVKNLEKQLAEARDREDSPQWLLEHLEAEVIKARQTLQKNIDKDKRELDKTKLDIMKKFQRDLEGELAHFDEQLESNSRQEERLAKALEAIEKWESSFSAKQAK